MIIFLFMRHKSQYLALSVFIFSHSVFVVMHKHTKGNSLYVKKHSKSRPNSDSKPNSVYGIIPSDDNWQSCSYKVPCSCRLTCSGLRPIRMDRTLEKKLAKSGLRGGSFWRKPYSFISSFSSSPSLSLIWLTSDVRSSHDILGYLEENKSCSVYNGQAAHNSLSLTCHSQKMHNNMPWYTIKILSR